MDLMRKTLCLAALAIMAHAAPGFAQPVTAQPAATTDLRPSEGDYHIRDFRFRSGETLADLRMHYATIGTPHRDARGRIDNAVLFLHVMTGWGTTMLQPGFAAPLFGPGAPLDSSKYFVIFPDAIGHGKSSRPQTELGAAFPKYDQFDIVAAQQRLLVDHLGVERLQLIWGGGMGCAQGFAWAQLWPSATRRIMVMGCTPVEEAGRMAATRRMAIDAIRNDPVYKDGHYTAVPTAGIRAARNILMLLAMSPRQTLAQFPSQAAVDEAMDASLRRPVTADANDFLRQLESFRGCDFGAGLDRITAKTLWINFTDDFSTPQATGQDVRLAARIRNGAYKTLGPDDGTNGPASFAMPTLWLNDLRALMDRPAKDCPPAPARGDRQGDGADWFTMKSRIALLAAGRLGKSS